MKTSILAIVSLLSSALASLLAEESGIQSFPFEASAEAWGDTLFYRVPPEESGIDLVTPIDEEHPLARAYHSSSACAAVAIGDIDLDGLPDVFAGNGPLDNALYLQRDNLRFVNIAREAGVTGGDEAWAVGISLVDVDDDGDLDIYVCNYDYPNQLFINLIIEDGRRNPGTPRFVDRAAELGLDIDDGSVVSAFADFDRDGDLDVYVMTHQVYRLGGRPADPIPLVEVNGRLMVGEEYDRWYELSEGKRGKNGEILYTEKGRPDYLLRNDGEDGFVEVTATAGITKDCHWGNSATWWDYNHDGWPDLYVGNDFRSPDFLYRNNGDGTFSEVSEGLVRHTTWFSMGAVQSDLNNDGLIDFLLADMLPRTHYMQKASMASMADRFDNLEGVGGAFQMMRNTLHINSGTDRFMEGAWLSNVADTEWTWAIRSADFDNDGWSDLFFCNGVPRQFNHSDLPEITHSTLVGKTHWDHYKGTPQRREMNLAFRNRGDFDFEMVSQEWGLAHVGMSYGASLGDLDRDGRVDLLVTNLEDPLSVYRNQGTTGNRIVVELEGTLSNRKGIGSVATLTDPDGGIQIRQLFPYGGFLDADEPIIHFGLGDHEKVSRLRIEWPSGKVQDFRDLEVNRRYRITEPGGEASRSEAVHTRRPTSPWFSRSPSLEGFDHRETEFDDFDRQPLMPLKLSQLGPGQAWGDIDGDGDLDFYLSGAAGQAGQLFINQTTPGSGEILLSPRSVRVFQDDAAHEDMGCLFFDANADGAPDLYVVSGGVECPPDSALLQDRLYLNTGGSFVRAPEGTLPESYHSGGVAAAADYDRDGDLDLFVGSRSIPGRYPESPVSLLLRNEGGRFVSATRENAPRLERAGLVTGALWSDADNDGWPDLFVTTDWGPIRLFRNDGGNLIEVTEQAGLLGEGLAREGWWHGIAGRDIDNDGDIDYVATNMGRNTYRRAGLTHPELIFYGDFDNSGKKHIVEAYFKNEEGRMVCYPRAEFMAAGGAMRFLLREVQTFHNYASASLGELYGVEKLAAADTFRANQMDSSVLVNRGDGTFEIRSLPRLAQISPGFGVALSDVDLDGFTDCYLVHNHFTAAEEIGIMGSGLGLLLRGTGDSAEPFVPVWPGESGLEVPGDAKSLAAVDLNQDGRKDFVVGLNDDSPEIFVNDTSARHDTHPLKVRLAYLEGNPTGVGARITVEAGGLAPQTAEVTAGGGYLSQSDGDLVFAVPNSATGEVAVTVRWPDGKLSRQAIQADASFLRLVRER